MSIDEFARTTPVRPSILNRNTNPRAHKQAALYVKWDPYIVASDLKILTSLGTAMIIVGWVPEPVWKLWGREKFLRLPVIEPPTLGCPARGLYRLGSLITGRGKKWTIMTVGNQYRSQGSLKMWKRNASTSVSRARWSSSVTDKLNSSHFVAPDPRDTARSRIPYIWKQYRPPEPDGESKSTFGKVSRALVLRLLSACRDGQTLVPSLFKQHYLIRTRYIGQTVGQWHVKWTFCLVSTASKRKS